jgi:hypothetical protein
MKAGKFPQCLKLGEHPSCRVVWLYQDLLNYFEERCRRKGEESNFKIDDPKVPPPKRKRPPLRVVEAN